MLVFDCYIKRSYLKGMVQTHMAKARALRKNQDKSQSLYVWQTLSALRTGAEKKPLKLLLKVKAMLCTAHK